MNISYIIREVKEEEHKKDIISVDELLDNLQEDMDKKYAEKVSEYSDNESMRLQYISALKLNYETNYTVKMLKHILEYYKINKGKRTKSEIIEEIVNFETDDSNYEIVEKRNMLWTYVKTLKNDEFFEKYILFDC